MASAEKNLSEYNPEHIPNAESMRFGIVVSEYNEDITLPLLRGCKETLLKHGAKTDAIEVIFVPGAYELPSAAKMIIKSKPALDAVICIGCVIKGETKHDEYINHAVAQGLVNLTIQYDIPVIFGVLTPNSRQQAIDRAGGKHGNKGIEAATTAIKMAFINNSLNTEK